MESKSKKITRRVLQIVGALIALKVIGFVFISLISDEDKDDGFEQDDLEQELVCGEVDVDLDRDRRHCGQCDRRCEDDEICRDGECGQALAWTALSAGGDGSGDGICGLRRDESLWCWGDDVETPRQIGESKWSSISVGHHERCGIQEDRSLWCWGAGQEKPELIEEFDKIEADQGDQKKPDQQEELHFFLAGDDLRWYTVDSTGLTLQRTLEIPALYL